MALLVSAKGNDVLAWRAAGDFSATFRQQLLARLEYCKSDEAELLLSGVRQALDTLRGENDAYLLRCETILGEVAAATDQSRFKELAGLFFSELYGHIGTYRSAAAFYEFSTRFLQSVSGAIVRQARTALGEAGGQLPQMKLIALGPAGRQEFSPFCPLHLLLVHGETGTAERENVFRLGRLIHGGFAACGFQVDAGIAPFNAAWCGTLPEWQQRLVQQLEHDDTDDLIDFFRLSDQTVLFQDEGFDVDFFQLCTDLLKNHRAAMEFQILRVLNLSHGIGIMGGMRFEKKGPYRGKFALLDNGLQPLAAAIATLALIKNLKASSTPQRIREVLWMRKLNVDMAERLLQSWHNLHELRLLRESATHPDWSDQGALHLEIDDLDNREQAVLRESLESVGAIQRHVGLNYSSMEG
jgi:signal-transduction protein with cAMP-binding, CBS, and nucleotidyltransferase domain